MSFGSRMTAMYFACSEYGSMSQSKCVLITRSRSGDCCQWVASSIGIAYFFTNGMTVVSGHGTRSWRCPWRSASPAAAAFVCMPSVSAHASILRVRWLSLVGLLMVAQGPAGVHLFYTDSGGSGVPVVLMHAATGSVRAWEHQTPAFVKAGYRVIVFDRRGWGRTTVDPNTPPGTAADDLIALMNSLHIDRVHLVGTAAGGFVT